MCVHILHTHIYLHIYYYMYILLYIYMSSDTLVNVSGKTAVGCNIYIYICMYVCMYFYRNISSDTSECAEEDRSGLQYIYIYIYDLTH